MIDLIPLSKGKRKFLEQLKSKKYRKKRNLFLGEGFRFIETALKLKAIPHSLYLEKNLTFPPHLTQQIHSHKIPMFEVSREDFRKISDTKTPQGILGVFPSQTTSLEQIKESKPSLILALDGLQDAGNLGSILRTAHGLGVSTILIGHNTVDVFQPKVVRASMGSIFALSLCPFLDLNIILEQFQKESYTLFTTIPREGVEPEKIIPTPKNIVIFGNEGAGISKEIQSKGDKKITIPLLSTSESLNVTSATSIILYHFSRNLKLLEKS